MKDIVCNFEQNVKNLKDIVRNFEQNVRDLKDIVCNFEQNVRYLKDIVCNFKPNVRYIQMCSLVPNYNNFLDFFKQFIFSRRPLYQYNETDFSI